MTRDSITPRERRTLRARVGACVRTALQVAVACLASFAPDGAHAYVGPGAGLSAIGTLLALLAAVLLAIVGFVWYPVKRLVKYLKNRRKVRAQAAEKHGADAS